MSNAHCYTASALWGAKPV